MENMDELDKYLKEMARLDNVALELTQLCSEYSKRAQTESHEDLEPLWNQIQEHITTILKAIGMPFSIFGQNKSLEDEFE